MLRSSMQAAVTMGQLQQKLDLIGHNVSNVNTTGYKTKDAQFSSLLFQEMDNQSRPEEEVNRLTPNGIRIGSGAQMTGSDVDFSQGSIRTTDRILDVAILGNNQLFSIQVTENGAEETRFTRDGAFYLSPVNANENMLVTAAGNPVLGEDGPILLQNDVQELTIREDGRIMSTVNGQQVIEGQLAMVEAVRPRMLEATGGNLYRLPTDVGLNVNGEEIVAPMNQDEVRLQSGALETSNVDLSKQLTDLTVTQRAYQLNSQSIKLGDQMMGLINGLR
ncbi:flagellar hook-basal body protein [Pontibacillus halophilus JSM 076056 = DSM 19796]|uniref:Flagellar hook-basal body protein n=1 Tax=Pontibacillus halophilus JSM 076056 = DSM 19796 TaxID=1385510 RepID=A0A0A5GRN2_9BACI|nr:flagellar hook-basal body protein [Pontibacillus halophilus]KGX93903.1 flagellar hook-basal body protein [Pontibacillus halophilus JSM 076056 = DSM 19796]